uniref:Uncharacterized protein n=1 Tax=Arundo donax TaxID=35708 RepID=A0A0A9BYS8_ARUDO
MELMLSNFDLARDLDIPSLSKHLYK